jgi:YHS domain-containing protein
LIGSWKGQGVPKDNPAERFRGWTETHTWAWVFAKGKPIGMSVSIRGGKIFEQATLMYDESQKGYRLEGKGTGASGRAILFLGKLDSSGKLLTLERIDKGGQERLTLRANSNFIRYTLGFDRKEEGVALFKPKIEVGLTKEGESFAAGSTVAARALCIVTGSAASMTVSYQGQTYPICCTGCRDEFNENPEKYLKKLGLKAMETSAGSAKAGQPGATREQLNTRAGTLLRLGRNLEKTGKTAAALKYYRQIVKECPGTPSEKTAAERIKALESP